MIFITLQNTLLKFSQFQNNVPMASILNILYQLKTKITHTQKLSLYNPLFL